MRGQWREFCASLVAIGLAMVGGCAWRAQVRPLALPSATAVTRTGLKIHTDFYLPPRHRLLDELVQLRTRMHEKLGLRDDAQVVQVYLFQDRDHYLGYMRQRYTDFPDRRACFVEDADGLYVYAFWGNRVAEDLRHEVAHGYLHAACAGIPLWLDEGIAEYFEMDVREAGRNPTHQEWFWGRREQKQAWHPDLVRLEQAATAADLTAGDYAESWLWVHWLLHQDDQSRAVLRDYLELLASAAPAPPFSVFLESRRPRYASEFERYARRFLAAS